MVKFARPFGDCAAGAIYCYYQECLEPDDPRRENPLSIQGDLKMSYFVTPNMEINTGRGLDVFTDLAETIDQLEELREKKKQKIV